MKTFSNSFKVWFFLVLVSLLFLILGYELADRLGLLLGFLFAVSFNILIFYYGDSQLMGFFKTRHVEGSDPWGLLQTVRLYARQLQMLEPAIFVVEHDQCFAFSLGPSRKRGRIFLSTGLLKKFSSDEIAATLAHQVSQIHRLDTFGFGVSHTLVQSLLGFSNFLDQLSPWNLKGPRFPLFLWILSPFIWVILKLSVRPQVYFANDDLASSLIKDRKKIAETLWKLDAYAQAHPINLPPGNSHFFIVNPLGKNRRHWFLLTHPNIDIRVKRLVGYYPL